MKCSSFGRNRDFEPGRKLKELLGEDEGHSLWENPGPRGFWESTDRRNGDQCVLSTRRDAPGSFLTLWAQELSKGGSRAWSSSKPLT
jgi:hypothetical protein